MSNGWGDGVYGHGNWNQQANATVTTITGVSSTSAVSSVSVEATIGSGWSRDAWNSLGWGVAYSVQLTSASSTFSLGSTSHVADALVSPTGVSATTALGTATGEPEHVIFPTGLTFETQLSGALSIEEGAGVVLPSLLTSFAVGDETGSGTVDVGWGRNNWGSFAWNENIEFFANVTGVSMSSALGTTTQEVGTGVIVSVTGVSMTGALGTTSQTGTAVETLGSLTVSAALSGATVSGEGSVAVVAPSDQLDFAIGTPFIDIFTQIDPVPVTMTSAAGTATVEADCNVTLSSVAMNSALGTPTIQTGTGIIVSVSTVAMTFTPGTVTPSGEAVVDLTGVSSTFELGQVFSTPWANVVTGASNTWTEVDAA